MSDTGEIVVVSTMDKIDTAEAIDQAREAAEHTGGVLVEPMEHTTQVGGTIQVSGYPINLEENGLVARTYKMVRVAA